MAGASISGLGSGLDTSSIIRQLMQLEALPQSKLKTKLGTEQSALKTIQDLNAKVAALTTAVADLGKAGAWSPLKATSSLEGLTVATTSGSASGSVSIRVDALAAAHSLRFSSTARTTDVVVADGTEVTLTVNGQERTLDTGDGTLGGLVNALNASGTGVRASTMRLDDGSYRLTVQSAASGAASSFALTAADGTDLLGGATVQAGQDAAITIGGDTIHSATNTFTGLLPGVDVTVSAKALGQTAVVDLAGDAAGARDKAKGLVEKVNELLAQLEKVTAYDATAKKAGALGGNNTVRDLRTRLLEAVYPPDGGTMSGVGIQTDRYGNLVFDATAFDKAYAADASGAAAALTGFAGRLETIGARASDKIDGSLTSLATGKTQQIDRLQDSIDAWDARLELREKTLTRTYTALDVALSRLNSQSGWLAGQLGSLSRSSE